MYNLTQHFSNQPTFFAIFIPALVVIAFSVPYFLKQQKRYGSAFDYAAQSRKNLAGIACAALIGLFFYGFFTPYTPPPTNEIAIVLGNTQNTPAPSVSGDIADAIKGTMLQHKGDPVDELANSIKVISAIKHPEVISLVASELKLKEIGNNGSNAARNANINIKAIEHKINTLSPTDNGVNYFEAILKARDNVKVGSKIIVIGSGLSDEGDLNFSKTNILTNEQSRLDVIEKVKTKYGNDYLDGYNIEFYGIGDTSEPQESLSSKQKEIVREFYKNTIRALGGNVEINTKTMVGDSVKTTFVVSATDTGCGNIGLIFDDNSLKFVGDKATFIDAAIAKNSLTTIKTLWDNNRETIKSIQVDGYIAHHPVLDNLSQLRADQTKKALVELGVPSDKVNATGQGFGPYELDTQNRMVKVTISRDSDQCEN